LVAQVAFNIFSDALFAANEFAVVLDPQRQQDGGILELVGRCVRFLCSGPGWFVVGSDIDPAVPQVAVQGALGDMQLSGDGRDTQALLAIEFTSTGLVSINRMSRCSEGGADCSHEEASAAPHR
jgi:hypothetical protein